MVSNKDKNTKPVKQDTELTTEPPLSEKDEVKEAEARTMKKQKKTDSSVAAEIRNRKH